MKKRYSKKRQMLRKREEDKEYLRWTRIVKQYILYNNNIGRLVAYSDYDKERQSNES